MSERQPVSLDFEPAKLERIVLQPIIQYDVEGIFGLTCLNTQAWHIIRRDRWDKEFQEGLFDSSTLVLELLGVNTEDLIDDVLTRKFPRTDGSPVLSQEQVKKLIALKKETVERRRHGDDSEYSHGVHLTMCMVLENLGQYSEALEGDELFGPQSS